MMVSGRPTLRAGGYGHGYVGGRGKGGQRGEGSIKEAGKGGL